MTFYNIKSLKSIQFTVLDVNIHIEMVVSIRKNQLKTAFMNHGLFFFHFQDSCSTLAKPCITRSCMYIFKNRFYDKINNLLES